MRRENAEAYSVSSSALCAIAHWGGRSSIPETAMMETIGRGVLDAPPSRSMTTSDVDAAQPSKRLAQKLRSLDPISPRQLDRLGNSDPHAGDDLGFAEPRMQGEWRRIQRQRIMFDGDAERLAELAGPRTQRA